MHKEQHLLQKEMFDSKHPQELNYLLKEQETEKQHLCILSNCKTFDTNLF